MSMNRKRTQRVDPSVSLHGRYPRALIVGHHDLNPRKACPCIPDLAREYGDLNGLPPEP